MNPCKAVRSVFEWVGAVTQFTVPAGSVQRAGYAAADALADVEAEQDVAEPADCYSLGEQSRPPGFCYWEAMSYPPSGDPYLARERATEPVEAVSYAPLRTPPQPNPGGGEVHSGETPPPGSYVLNPYALTADARCIFCGGTTEYIKATGACVGPLCPHRATVPDPLRDMAEADQRMEQRLGGLHGDVSKGPW